MSIKSDLLAKLEKEKGNYISGQELANSLGVSRTAVWKAVGELKDQGYPINAATNKGYTLSVESSILSIEAITQFLDADVDASDIIIHKTVDSTNNEAKRLVMKNSPNGTIILAEQQTAGKGRRGRSFATLCGDSIYVSFILKPMWDVEDSIYITAAASVAVVRALDRIAEITGQNIASRIKWVNDIFVEDKKICGILTEAVTDLESGRIESLILGIGINVNIDTKLVSDELKGIVGSVQIPPGLRNRFVAILINEVFNVQKEIKLPSVIQEYRSRSMVLGKAVIVMKGDVKKEAIASNISDRGELLVEYKTGETELLHTGEISIRLKDR